MAGLGAAALGGTALLAALALQDQPLLPANQPPSIAQFDRLRALLRLHDPRQALPGLERRAVLTTGDLDTALDQALRRLAPAAAEAARGRITLPEKGSLRLLASLPLPPGPWQRLGHWLNLQASWQQQPEGLPAMTSLKLGHLPLPPSWAQSLWPLVLRASGLTEAEGMLRQTLVRAEFDPPKVVVTYAWPEGAGDRVARLLLPADLAGRMQPYVRLLASQLASEDQAAKSPTGGPRHAAAHPREAPRKLDLAPALAGHFALAHQRSLQGEPAALENRAALLALTLAPYPELMRKLLPASAGWGLAPNIEWRLAGRPDFPLHFLISAVAAAEHDAAWADALGVYKEVIDSRFGSGFSFNDIAADRAGSRLGRLAVDAPQWLQAGLMHGLRDAELLPPVDDLPEFMSAAAFHQRYGGVGAPAYLQMQAEIDRRLDALPLLNPRR